MAKLIDSSIEVSYREYLEMIKSYFFVLAFITAWDKYRDSENFNSIVNNMIEEYFPEYLQKEEKR